MPESLQPDCVIIWYLKLRIFDLTEFIVWNLYKAKTQILCLRYGKEFACFSSVSNALLSKCAKFLKYEVSRNYRILSEFQKDDFELFQVL